MKDNTAKMLGLEDVIIKKIWEAERDRHIEIELPRRRHKCPRCKEYTEKIHDYRKHNISPTTAIRYFNMVNYSCKALPEVLSIDEFKGDVGGEKYQTILTDAKNRKILDILPDRKKITLIRYFRKFKSRKDVKVVVIDINPPFREVAEIFFPKATIVTDRYHVTRQAIWALERVRKAEQKMLSDDWRRFCKHSKAILSKPPKKLNDHEREKLRIILGLSTRLEQAYCDQK